jgi:hypothetical protein
MDCNPIVLELGISIEPNQKLHGQGGSGCEDRELGGELQRRVATWGVTYQSGMYYFYLLSYTYSSHATNSIN